MANAMASFEAESKKLAELGRHWAESSTTARAKDRSLEITVDGRGELVDIVFNSAKYRTLAPPRLAQTIVETLQSARAQAMAKMSDLMGPSGIPGLDLDGLVTGKIKPEEMLDALAGPMLDTLEGFGVESPLPRPAGRAGKEHGSE
jgi:DNA-binding protein YbaB